MYYLHNVILLLMLVPWPNSALTVMNYFPANFYYMKRKVGVVSLKHLLNDLFNLYNNCESTTNQFKKNIIQYNCFFQMTSFDTKAVFPRWNGWNVSMIVQGQTHHHIKHLMPDSNQYANYIQRSSRSRNCFTIVRCKEQEWSSELIRKACCIATCLFTRFSPD